MMKHGWSAVRWILDKLLRLAAAATALVAMPIALIGGTMVDAPATTRSLIAGLSIMVFYVTGACGMGLAGAGLIGIAYAKSHGFRVYLYAAAVTFLMTASPLGAHEGDRASLNEMRTHSLPIFYDSALSAKGFPNPLVKARLAGHEAIFIVDTGASVNLLADWFAEAAKIQTSAATDSTVNGSGGGTSVPRMTRRIQGRWSNGQPFALRGTMVVPFPPYFKSTHIGGLLSPQKLAPAGMAAVLDLKVPSLQFMPFTRALSSLHHSKKLADPLPLQQECHSEAADRVYLAPVTSAGVADLVVVDTGATKTIFSEESKIAHEIESRSELGPRSEGVGGEMKAQRMVRDVQLLRGGESIMLSPSIGKVSAPCDAKGLLGMDALRSCLLILGDHEMVLACG